MCVHWFIYTLYEWDDLYICDFLMIYVFKNMYKFLWLFVNVCKYLKICINLFKYLQMYKNIYKFV